MFNSYMLEAATIATLCNFAQDVGDVTELMTTILLLLLIIIMIILIIMICFNSNNVNFNNGNCLPIATNNATSHSDHRDALQLRAGPGHRAPPLGHGGRRRQISITSNDQ